MTKKYEVTRYYTVADVYHVEAENEDEAYRKACAGDYSFHKSYDSDVDDNYDVIES
jgi:hypothetical protein